jgi:uncharacterized protein (DUF849 family)
MKRAEKVIITCAVTGGIHTPTMSEYLPITPDQIAEQAVEAAEAGAAILHLHARVPETGRPTQDPDVYMQFLPRIKQRTDAVINITTGGGLGMTMDERLSAAHRAQPEVTSLNMGSMNFGVWKLADRYSTWQHDWEAPYLASTKDSVYSNTFGQIERTMRELGDGYGTRFEFECYDMSHLYTLAHFAEMGLVKPPFFIQCIFGVLGGMGAEPENLTHMKGIADRLFGDDYYLSVLSIGRSQMPMLTMGAIMGGNVRVGLEDNLYIGKGKLAVSNAEQVAKVKRILEELGLQTATPAEARAMLKLKGGDSVAF